MSDGKCLCLIVVILLLFIQSVILFIFLQGVGVLDENNIDMYIHLGYDNVW